jgi:hypothetical protein
LAGSAWLLLLALCACSGDRSHDRDPPASANSGSGGSKVPVAGGAAGTAPFNNPDASTAVPPRKPVVSTAPDGGECGATSMTAEQVVVEMHMDVTEEVTSIAPVAIYIMLDQSASMLPLWPDALAGIKAFASDPKSSGTDVAMDFFPSIFGEAGECNGVGYDAPFVPMGRLPAHAAMINAQLDALPLPTGIGTPIEGALNGLKRFCEQFQSTHADEKCIGVLVTDGTPLFCNEDLAQLADISAQAHANGVTTYAVGLTGSDFAFLDQVAMLGGAKDCDAAAATYACDVTAGAALLVDALSKIRDTIVEVKTHTVTTTKTVETPLPCEWALPATQVGQTFDREKVNVQLNAPSAGQIVFGKVEQEAQCARNGWYYDDPGTPTRIIACPETCELITTTAEATVDILLGCRTVPLT